jgi:hypothetical protein
MTRPPPGRPESSRRSGLWTIGRWQPQSAPLHFRSPLLQPNLVRGFGRLTWLASVLLASPGLVFALADPSGVGLWLGLAGVGFIIPWLALCGGLWVARGFAAQAPGTDGSEAASGKNSWLRISRPFLRPFVRRWAFSYFGRPHCRFPAPRTDSWGIVHVVCGEPPVDVIDVRGLEGVLSRLGNHPLVEIMPKLLSAVADDSGSVAICEGHRVFLWAKTDEIFEKATEEQVEVLKTWLSQRPT